MKTIYLDGDVGYEITAKSILNQIDVKSTERLQVIVNSAGGSVYEAFLIYNIFKSYKGKVEFVILGYALSAMSYILMSGDTISAFKNSVFMAHRVWTLMVGDADELQTEVDVMRKLENIIIEAYQTRLPGDKEEILEKMKKELWLIGWEDLTENKIIDNVIDKVEEIEVDEEKIKDLSEIIEEANNEKDLLNLKIKKINDRMKNEKTESNYKNIAAHFDKPEFNTVEKPVENNITGEDDMSLQDYLKSNPEAKAEYEKDLEAAEAIGKENSDVTKDRKRIVSILKMSGVKITKESAEAISSDMSDGEFAKSVIAKQNELRDPEKNGVDFGSLVKNQLPKDQDKTQNLSKEELEKEKAEIETKIKNFVESASIGGNF